MNAQTIAIAVAPGTAGIGRRPARGRVMAQAEPDAGDGDQLEVVLLQRIAASGDVAAFEALYGAYRRRLGSFIFRLVQDDGLCEEVFNDVMLAVWRQAADFNGGSKVSTWVFAIAYRQGLNRLRSRREHVEISDDHVGSGDDAAAFEQRDLVRRALLHLSPEHRLAIELAYYQGYNYREIAEISRCPENTVKTRIFHARRRMREVMEDAGRAAGE